ncbi:MAG: MFS transporter, partial [Chloroflexi bacterium]|nr:MFS transporter [Chloroflexota bacterium]
GAANDAERGNGGTGAEAPSRRPQKVVLMIVEPDAPAQEPPPPQHFDALKISAFRLLLVGSVATGLAQQMQWVASGFLVYDLTGSAWLLGLTGLFRAAPVFLFSLIGGALADAVDRRKVMLFCQSLAAAVSAGVALLAWSGALEVWHLYAATFLTAVSSALFNPTRMAMTPYLVPRNLLTNAVTFNTVAQQTSQLLGPAAAGIALAAFHGRGAFALCSAAFAISVAASIGLPSNKAAADGAPRSRTEHLAGGLHFVRAEPIMIGLLVMDWGVNILTGGVRTLMPVFAKDVLMVGPDGLGVLSGAPGLGAILGVIATLRLYSAILVAFSLSTWFPLSVLLLAGVGYFDSFAMVMRNTMILMITPDALRGRVQSVVQMVTATGPALAGVLSGAVASAFGAGAALALGGALSLALVGLVHLRIPAVWRFRSRDEG